jgi:hypothetical protein
MRREGMVAAAAALAAAALVSGCAGSFGLQAPRKANTPPRVDPAVTSAVLLANHLETVQRLVQSTPLEQAQILATVKRNYDLSPATPSHELEYALVLSVPGHSGFDPGHAEQLLQDVLAARVSLTPSERALAVLVLSDVQRQLDLAAENERLQEQSAHTDHVLMAAANHRLQLETEENARLRKELDQTRVKLNEIANIERSLNRRKPSTPSKPSTQGPTQ